jgi:hypothetical protein
VSIRLHARRIGGASVALAVLTGCGSSATLATTDGGRASSDGSSRDAGVETGPRGRADARVDAGAHRSTDAAVDARVKTGFDASSDAWMFAPTLPVASLEQNNTSACGADAAPCTTAWAQTHSVTYSTGSTYAGQTLSVTAFWDNAVPPGPQAPGSPHGYVSKVPVSALLPDQTVPIWVETQNWWGGGNGHIDNGEVSSKSAQMANEVADHISRGFAGQVVDWYGPGTTADLGLPSVEAAAEASSGAYQFAVMIDKAYFAGGCGETVACLNSGLAYVATHYGTSPAYLKDASGKPIIFFFINQYYTTEYAILTGPGVDAGGAVFEMYEPNGFPGKDPANTIGEYAWVNPADGAGNTTTSGAMGSFAWETDFGFKDLNSYFSAADGNPTSFLVSEAHKGFDDNLANWSLNRVIDQRCGLTWLQTFDHTGTFGGSATYLGNLNYLESGKHLDFVLVDTWDDYEEGSEIETGIDNCMSSLSVTLTGSTLDWAPTWGADPMNAAETGSEATLYAYAIYAAAKGTQTVMWLGDVLCTNGMCDHSVDVSGLGVRGGPYVFYVQAVGQPSIRNHLAGPTAASYTGG